MKKDNREGQETHLWGNTIVRGVKSSPQSIVPCVCPSTLVNAAECMISTTHWMSSVLLFPYAHSPSVRKLSKIATMLLAKNYILMQANALEEMRRLITYMNSTPPPAPSPVYEAFSPYRAAAAVPPSPRLPPMTPRPNTKPRIPTGSTFPRPVSPSATPTSVDKS